ncbi:MAG TPA: hypothetical protein VHM90_10890 [Phycisphaerae bacterium]|nr:hypothetical protein [Phycisphaerae bacterium]
MDRLKNLKRIERMEVIDDKSAEFMRRLTGEQRVQLACRLEDSLRQMVRRRIRDEHPDWTEPQIRRELARRQGFGSLWPSEIRFGNT